MTCSIKGPSFIPKCLHGLIRSTDELVTLNTVIELMRDLDRPRGATWEVAVGTTP